MKLKRVEASLLEIMYHEKKMTQEAIAKALQVDRHTIIEWLQHYGIPARVTSQKRIQEATLRALYCDQGMTQEEIGRHLQVHPRSIRRWMKHYNIPHHPFSGKTNGNYKDGKRLGTYQYRRMKPLEQCSLCPATDNLCVHHVNFDHYDNHPDNLRILCVSCHISLHKKAYWDSLKKGETPRKSNGPIGWNRAK